MMSCLCDKSSHAVLPGKCLFEHGGCEAHDKSDDPGRRRISAEVEMRPPKVIGKAILVTVGTNGSSQRMYFDTLNGQDSAVDPKTLHRKYPHPNIRKEISVSQQFPGRLNHVSSPKYEVLTNGEYDVEQGPLAEMKQRDNEQMGGEIHDDGRESNLEGNAFKDIADFVKTESRNLKVTRIDKFKPVGGVTPAREQKLEDREDTSNMCASRSNMLRSDLKFQMVSDNGHGAKSHVGRMGNDSARCILPVKPRVKLARSELKFKATKPLVSRGEVDVTELRIPLKNMETGCSIAKRKVELENLEGNDSTLEQMDALDSSEASSKPHLLHGKYPPPKFQKGVSILLKFPQGCGRLDNASSSKCEVLSNVESGADLQPLVETIQTDNEQITCEYHEDGSAFAREVEAEILEDIDDELKAETGKGTEVENDKLFDLQTNLNCQMACADGGKSQVGRIGCDSEKCIRYKLCGDKPGSVDLPPSFGGSVTGMQQGKKMSNCALTEAAVGCKDKKDEFMGSNQSKYLNLKQDGTNASEWNFAKEDVKYLDAVSEDRGKHGDSIVLSYSQADLSRRKVREALNLFKQILEKLLLNVRKVSLDTYVQAAMQLKKRGKWVNMNERVLGAVPGVEIGDKFHCRAELVIIGLHRPFEAGIAFVDKDGKKIATSIVDSGRYANETKFTGVLIYSGEGGNPAIRHKKIEDQTLVRGNLALKNSMEAGTPVRVIRRCRVWKSYRAGDRKRVKGATYTYDGLYVVSKYWQDKGKYGKLVYMFQLNKMQGQPNLAPNIFSSSGKSKILSKSRLSKALCRSRKSKLFSRSKKSKVRHDNTMVGDISCGKEKIPIRVVNGIDNEKPPMFNYIANMVYPHLNESSMTRCCQCIDGCSDYVKCSCVSKNRGTVPCNENGAIIRRRPIAYECGPFCKCPLSCKNRASQCGVQFQLEVFKTESRRWGVRSRNFISSGSFICEYVGELLNNKQADERIDCDEYLFHLGDGDGFAIDAAQFGNIGRFLNHSCSPNLYAQDVLFDHDNKRMPHVMLFATKNITPSQELTFHYNYKIGQVYDMNGNVKKKTCGGGARDCIGRMY